MIISLCFVFSRLQIYHRQNSLKYSNKKIISALWILVYFLVDGVGEKNSQDVNQNLITGNYYSSSDLKNVEGY